MDASNLLKPMLARGELHTIGATTLDEYRKHIEKDAALERRFQPVVVDQPTVEETISILRGLRERYEVHHGVRITDSALVAAATLSDRYITERFLPDKAIDLVDEAASRLRMEIDSMPVELDELERRRIQLEIEREALRKETDDASKARLEALERELAEHRRGRRRDEAALGGREDGDRRHPGDEVGARRRSRRGSSRPSARPTTARPPSSSTARLPELQARLQEQEAALAALQGPGRAAQGGGRRRTTSPRSSPPGPASRSPSCSRARRPSSSTWRSASTSGSSARTRRSRPCPTPSGGPGPGSRTRAGRSARSCSSARPASARPSSPGPSPSSSSTTTAAMVRIDMSEYMEKFSVSRLVGAPARLRRLRGGRPADRGGPPPAVPGRSCSTRSRRPTRTSSTSCSRSSTTAG